MARKECPGCGEDNSIGKWRICSICSNHFCEYCIGINDCDNGREIKGYYCPNCIEHCKMCGNVLNNINRLEIKYLEGEKEETIILCAGYSSSGCFNDYFNNKEELIISKRLLSSHGNELKP